MKGRLRGLAVGAGLALGLGALLAVPAAAHIGTITSVTLNGAPAPVTVVPGESIAVVMEVTNHDNNLPWRCSQWDVGSGTTDVDTGNHTGNFGVESESFPIMAPAAVGTHDLPSTRANRTMPLYVPVQASQPPW